MGHVYRARDTRLLRTVALKVLPLDTAPGDAQARLERFQREARTISSLSHPHICPLFDVGEQDGQAFLVMEHLEGETLAARLAEGPLPLERALRAGIQIASALAAAHRQGIVHRDLKPANVMLTREGVKLLDFGLAKLRAGEGPALEATRTGDLTEDGVILGTVPYMAPEQLEGREVDARADVFALGVVLYETVSGRRPFDGDSKARIMAAILHSEPALVSTFQPLSPPALDHLIRKCLAKDREERWQTAADVSIALSWILEGGSSAGLPPKVARKRDHRRGLLAGAAGLVLGAAAAGGAVWAWRRPAPPASRPPLRLELELAPPALVGGAQRALALSPDGARIAYVTGSREDHRLAVRLLSQPQSLVLEGTEGAAHPFFSPDGRWVAFSAGGRLKKVAADGGMPATLCATPGIGGGWGPDHTIVFSGGPGRGLDRVGAQGGEPEPFTALDRGKGETSHSYPHFLPDGRSLLYSVTTIRGAEITTVVQDLRTGARRTLLPNGYDARYLPSGHLVFTRGRSVMAVRLDLGSLTLQGTPVPMIEDLSGYMLYPVAQFDLSATGTLVYAPTPVFIPRHLVWVDRTGRMQRLATPEGLWENPQLSPDGRRASVDVRNDVWLVDVVRAAASRFTFGPGLRGASFWTPDGARVTYYCQPPDALASICWRRADGGGDEEKLFTRPSYVTLGGWSPDGRSLVFIENTVERGHDVGVFSFDDRQARLLLDSAFNERAPSLSPDGRWLAYSCDESGRREVYVQAFPDLGAKRQVSTDGGDEPVWGRNGKELFYRQGDDMMVVDVRLGPAFEAEVPRVLFSGRYLSFPQRPEVNYSVAADGRFLMVKRDGPDDPPLTVVVDWTQELLSRLPAPGRGR
jgi:eukaryotic-like serine/threonine-protein kinase